MKKIAKGERIAIDPEGPPPKIEFDVGGEVIAFYEVYLVQGQNPTKICQGSSKQPVQSCQIGEDTSALPGQKLQWQIKTAGGNESFPIDVTLTQGNKTLASYNYTSQGVDLLVDSVRFVSA